MNLPVTGMPSISCTHILPTGYLLHPGSRYDGFLAGTSLNSQQPRALN